MKRFFWATTAIVAVVIVSLFTFRYTGAPSAVAQPRVSNATQIAVGLDSVCAITPAGALKCWGYNGFGQLGQGNSSSLGDNAGEMGASLPTVDLNQTVKYISAGELHFCAIRLDNTTVCWGTNYGGQAGIDTISGDAVKIGDGPGEMGSALRTVDLGTSTAVSLSASSGYTCAVLADGSVKCWGFNESGRLGVDGHHGLGGSSMGTNLPAVALGTGRTATAVATGYLHTCVILDNGTVKCWGDNRYGQLGYGDKLSRVYPNLGDSLPTVNLGTGRTAKAIAAGSFSTCAILDNNKVKCWGANAVGQLGVDHKRTIGDGSGEMGNVLAAVNLGTGRTAKAIAMSRRYEEVSDIPVGRDTVCAILDNDTLKCWGANDNAQLGLGDTANRGDSTGEMAALPKVNVGTGMSVNAVALGYRSTCVMISTTDIKCFGSAGNGGLGIGEVGTVERDWIGDASGEMGDALPIIDLDGVAPTATLTPTASNTPTKTKTRTKTKTPTKTRTKTRIPTRTPNA